MTKIISKLGKNFAIRKSLACQEKKSRVPKLARVPGVADPWSRISKIEVRPDLGIQNTQ